ncbi:hypothetical protein KY290_000667 [Solanum tuberosum]|uniref:Uncharacterized protein n=1 Tax=Solanum tuberosum TaxID=4113 RepID=A0ABQ7WJZ2_SOLTU|nr:hypothetical protein KY290_000667 [Solanum tuberosum]
MNETFHGSLSWTLHRYAPYVDLDDNKAFLLEGSRQVGLVPEDDLMEEDLKKKSNRLTYEHKKEEEFSLTTTYRNQAIYRF